MSHCLELSHLSSGKFENILGSIPATVTLTACGSEADCENFSPIGERLRIFRTDPLKSGFWPTLGILHSTIKKIKVQALSTYMNERCPGYVCEILGRSGRYDGLAISVVVPVVNLADPFAA